MKKILVATVVVLAILSVSQLKAQSYLPELILVKGGSFLMGRDGGSPEEGPAHKITLNTFSIGKYEVTVAQYRQFCNETKRVFPKAPDSEDWYEEHYEIKKWIWRDNHPIVNVNWFDATAYCEWLSKKTGRVYRLPTEAEWEYAARGGQKSKSFKYSGSNNINEVCWYDETTLERGTMPVGTLKPNELGIHDMSGNAWEWCADYYGHTYYKTSPKANPKGPNHGQFRVIRGGSWYYVAEMASCTLRDGPYPEFKNWNYGFRIVREE